MKIHNGERRLADRLNRTLLPDKPITIGLRTIVCEIFGNDWRSSLKNLEDSEVPALAHISHDSDSERPTKVASRKHSVETQFPKDRNCEVCLRTKMTRAPCRRRTGEAVLRAEKFGDLITADHKVLNEGCGSRDNIRYAVVVQDQAIQRIHSYPCKAKNSSGDGKEFTKRSRTVGKAKSRLH